MIGLNHLWGGKNKYEKIQKSTTVTAKRRHYAGRDTMMTKSEKYDYSEKYFQCNQKTQRLVELMGNEDTNKNDEK